MSVSIEENAYNLRSRKIVKRKLLQTLEPRPRSKKTHSVEEGGDKVVTPKAAAYEPPPFGSHSREPFRTYFPKAVISEEAVRFNRKKWVIWAEKALKHYNSKENANFKLVEVMGVQLNLLGPRCLVHMTFTAQLGDDTRTELFYAELYVVWVSDEVLEVKGCCLMEKVDSGNPKSRPCGLCQTKVKHPGPRYGYRSASGDEFANSHFSW